MLYNIIFTILLLSTLIFGVMFLVAAIQEKRYISALWCISALIALPYLVFGQQLNNILLNVTGEIFGTIFVVLSPILLYVYGIDLILSTKEKHARHTKISRLK